MGSTSDQRAPLELRPTVESDLDLMLDHESDPDAAPFVIGWSRERHMRAIDHEDESHLVIERGGKALGFVLLAGLAGEDDNVELRRIVVARKGEGVGRAALALVLDRAFARHRAHRVWLDVLPHNVRALAAYEAVGFVREGIARESLRTAGGHESLVLMSVLAPEWMARRGVEGDA